MNPPFIWRDVEEKHIVGKPRFFAEFMLKAHGRTGAGSRGFDFDTASFDCSVAASAAAGCFSESAVDRRANSGVFANLLNDIFTDASDVVAFELSSVEFVELLSSVELSV